LLCKHIKLFPNFYFSPASNTICTIKKHMPIIFSVSLTYITQFSLHSTPLLTRRCLFGRQSLPSLHIKCFTLGGGDW
jgi:hypothetical protein